MNDKWRDGIIANGRLDGRTDRRRQTETEKWLGNREGNEREKETYYRIKAVIKGDNAHRGRSIEMEGRLSKRRDIQSQRNWLQRSPLSSWLFSPTLIVHTFAFRFCSDPPSFSSLDHAYSLFASPNARTRQRRASVLWSGDLGGSRNSNSSTRMTEGRRNDDGRKEGRGAEAET